LQRTFSNIPVLEKTNTFVPDKSRAMLMGIFEPMSQRIDRLTPPRHCKTKLIHPVALLLGLPILENPEGLALSPVCHELGLLQQEEPANLALAFWAGHLVPVCPIHGFQTALYLDWAQGDPLAIDHPVAGHVMDHGFFGVLAGIHRRPGYPLTASFRPLPALKPGILVAAIVISRPVWGLRPIRSGLSLTANVPNPTRVMESPAFNVASMVLVKASRARPASALLKFACAAMALISSDLFIFMYPWLKKSRCVG
jgi:hypothetical protein